MWVTEIEHTHQARLLDILRRTDCLFTVRVGNLKGTPTLILSDRNIAERGFLPVECLKYIYKTFNAPHQCRDAYWFRFHPVVKDLIRGNAVVRVQSIPKSMGPCIAEALIGDDETGGIMPENISFTNHTHIFQCLYSLEDSCFYWGVALTDDPLTQTVSWSALHQAVVNSYAEKKIVPVCRAYFKMQEIIEHYFPLWSWELSTDFHAVDIGASPGGWTQYIAFCTKALKVLAVDPGDITPHVLACNTSSVTHCKALAEAAATASALSTFGGFSLCVCDINCDAWVAIAVLIKHVLPHCGIYSSDDENSSTFGYLILTLKMAKNPKDKQIHRAVETVIKALSNPEYNKDSCRPSCNDFSVIKGWDFKVVHLNANSRNERTIICKYAIFKKL